MTRLKLTFVFLSFGLFAVPSHTLAQGSLNINLGITQFDVVNINNLVFDQADWFWIDVDNNFGQPTRIVFIVSLSKDGEELARAETEPYLIPITQPGQPYRVQGQDFGTKIGLASSEIFESGGQIRDALQSKGILPVGVYLLTITAIAVDMTGVEAQDDEEIIVRNPTSAYEPLSPGVDASTDPSNWPKYYSNILTFVWFTTAQDVTLQVVEAQDLNNPEGNFELDPVILVHLSGDIRTFTTGSGTSSNSNVVIEKYIDLPEGKFLWRIINNVQTTGGLDQLASFAMGFEIAKTDTDAGIAYNRVLSQLESLLGEQKVEELFGPGGPLHGASLGEMTKDGKRITPEDLDKIIRNFLDGKIRVVEDIVQ